MSKRILFVFTSANKTLTGGDTGYYLPEAAHPYYVLEPHFEIDFASPAGSAIPLDEGSKEAFKEDPDSVKFLQDKKVNERFLSAKKLSDVDPSQYVAVFYPGGHGPVIDLPFDENNTKVGNDFWRSGKVTAAVCHGPAALVAITAADGKSVFSGVKATGFSNSEEEAVGQTKAVPFLLESKLKELGANYEKADKDWGEKVVVSGKLITGQNPASAKAVGEAILAALK